MPPENFLHRVASFPDARRASRAHRPTGRGDKWTAETSREPHHVLQHAIVHRVHLIVKVESVRATGQKLERTLPAGLWLFGFGNKILQETKKTQNKKNSCLKEDFFFCLLVE